MTTKTERVEVRMTPEERAELERVAAEWHTDVATIVRESCRYAIRSYYDPNKREAMRPPALGG